jgi:hypothetical protein
VASSAKTSPTKETLGIMLEIRLAGHGVGFPERGRSLAAGHIRN